MVLIRKNRPAWQSGLLNGVGGKVEAEESPRDAMVREFEEETGARVEMWRHFCVHEDTINGYHVTYYRSFGDVATCRSTTDEQVEVVLVDHLQSRAVVPNLRWLVPMALDATLSEAHTVWR